MYRRQDVQLLKGLRRLLYDDGYTIKGAQKYLREHGVASVAALADASTPSPDPALDIKASPAATEAAAPSDDIPVTLQSAEQPYATRLSGGQIDLARSALSRLEQARARLSEVLEKTA
jgi:DNA-binding transcriptional MerR regulator